MVAFRENGPDRVDVDEAEDIIGRAVVPFGYQLSCFQLMLNEVSACEPIGTGPLPFSRKTLEECSGTHVLLLDAGLSIRQIVERHNQGVLGLRLENMTNRFQTRASDPRWRLVRMAPAPDTLGLTHRDQIKKGLPKEDTPDARALVYAMTAWFHWNRERVFGEMLVRTSSVYDRISTPHSVAVGSFGPDGIEMDAYGESRTMPWLGLASERIPDFRD